MGSRQNPILDKFNITGELISFNVTGNHGTQLTNCKLAQAKIRWSANSTKMSSLQLTVKNQESIEVGKSVYYLREMKKSYPYFSCVAFKEIDLKKVKVISGQKAYELIRTLEYKISGRNKPLAVKLPLGCTVSGPLLKRDPKMCDASCQLASPEDLELAEIVKNWWDMESYGILIVADQRSKKDKIVDKILNSTVKFNGELQSRITL